MPRVHNISNITSTNPMSINIGLVKIRPGKFKDVPSESINSKTKALHGVVLWIGDYLPKLKNKNQPPRQVLSMDREAVSSYLRSLTITDLQSLLGAVSPQPEVLPTAPHRRYVYAIRAACFSGEYSLDPETFYWLGRWTKLPNGDYKEV
jgi:hypothetical protein